MPDGELKPLTRHKPDTELEDGHKGASKTIGFIARQWASPLVKEHNHQHNMKTENSSMRKQENTERPIPEVPLRPVMLSGLPGADKPVDLDIFLSRLKSHTFSISCMTFQDAWNLDLERVRDCCIHVIAPDGGLIPFCMYNLTDIQGRSLYRKQRTWR